MAKKKEEQEEDEEVEEKKVSTRGDPVVRLH